MRRKHADLIIAWANGADLQILDPFDGVWHDINSPCFINNCEYRINPGPKQDEVFYAEAACSGYVSTGYRARNEHSNLKLTFDGETGKLKSAEVL